MGKFTIFSFLFWRVGLLIIAATAPFILPSFAARFPYWQERLISTGLPSWIWSWGNFDGVHYLGIAKDGYSAEFTQVFFPLYPFLISFLGRLIAGQFLIAGLLISNIGFLLALVLLFKLISQDFNLEIAKKALIFLLIFPTSFYFGSIYTEGLFLAEILAAFYFAQKGKWLVASVFVFFASLTRFIGIFLFPALVFEFYLQNKPVTNYKLLVTRIAPLFLIPTGLGIYMIYLALNFGNPFYFLTAQPVFGAQRTAAEIVLFPQVIFRYLKIFVTVNPVSLAFYNAVFEFLVTLIFGILIILSFFKTRISWAIFAALAFITPTLTGTFSSMPRYVLAAFPAFLVLAQIKNKLVSFSILIIFLSLLIISTAVFVRGYWLA